MQNWFCRNVLEVLKCYNIWYIKGHSEVDFNTLILIKIYFNVIILGKLISASYKKHFMWNLRDVPFLPLIHKIL